VLWSLRLDGPDAEAAAARARALEADLADLAGAADADVRLLRRRLVRALIAQVTAIHPDDVRIARTAEGAPVLEEPEGCHFSVSGGWPLCLIGIAREPIGVDVEPLDDSPPLRDMLTALESKEVASPTDWLARWTAKEAHAKRLGRARDADPAEIETEAKGEGLFLCTSPAGMSQCRVRILDDRVEAAALSEWFTAR
jgi:phosphopantetheinyl transferase